MNSTYSDCLIIFRFSSFSGRKVFVTYVSHANCIKQLTVTFTKNPHSLQHHSDFYKSMCENVMKTTPS